jgi:hypothetical protein
MADKSKSPGDEYEVLNGPDAAKVLACLVKKQAFPAESIGDTTNRLIHGKLNDVAVSKKTGDVEVTRADGRGFLGGGAESRVYSPHGIGYPAAYGKMATEPVVTRNGHPHGGDPATKTGKDAQKDIAAAQACVAEVTKKPVTAKPPAPSK